MLERGALKLARSWFIMTEGTGGTGGIASSSGVSFERLNMRRRPVRDSRRTTLGASVCSCVAAAAAAALALAVREASDLRDLSEKLGKCRPGSGTASWPAGGLAEGIVSRRSPGLVMVLEECRERS